MKDKIRVMLVDDETDFSKPVAFWLESKGYSVTVAPEGETALELIEKSRPDIIFLDLRMPVMDGIETLRRIRKFDKQLPVIIVTAEYANENKFAEARKLGSSGFFPKKGSFEELEKIIETTLRTHRDIKRN